MQALCGIVAQIPEVHMQMRSTELLVTKFSQILDVLPVLRVDNISFLHARYRNGRVLAVPNGFPSDIRS